MTVVRILVLNPNSSAAVTDVIHVAVERLGLLTVEFTVDQLDAAPPAIETDEDERVVVPLVEDYVRRRAGEFDGFVIACHGDPGVGLARHHARTVLGIGETSMLVACAYADRFGLLTLGAGLVPAKRRQVEQAGLAGRCVAIEPTGTGVLHGVAPDVDLTPYLRAGRTALAHGAQAMVLGCAGMVNVCGLLAVELRVPVIEPVAATCLVAATASGGSA